MSSRGPALSFIEPPGLCHVEGSSQKGAGESERPGLSSRAFESVEL
jgi:hypothetical protein